MNKKNLIKLLVIGFVLFVLWFVFFAEVTIQTTIVAAFGHIIGQIIVVSCSAALVIWFFNKRSK